MTVIEQNRIFIEIWNSRVLNPELNVFPKYEETPIVLDHIDKMEMVGVGDKISSPTGLSSFVVERIDGRELITKRNGNKDI